jgi:hypothetical protein
MVFEWTDEPRSERDGWTHVWPGKTNVGRSASPRKKTDEGLVERETDELWWPAAGVQHPNCFVDGDMPVYTSKGWMPIKEIQIGDQVLTHKGRFRSVNWVLDDTGPYSGDVVSMRVSANGKNAVSAPRMTPEHPVLTSRGWVAARNILPGDAIVTLARKCPTCEQNFVNPKFSDVTYCGNKCIPKVGKNQYSTDDPDERRRQVEITREATRARMRGMTVEQREEITRAARARMAIKGFDHLRNPETKVKGGKSASRHNYTPSPVEAEIAAGLRAMGISAETQLRVRKGFPDSRGQMRYWWLDIAIPDSRIAVEIDGEPWHGRLAEEGKDEKRDDDLRKSGWTVMRFNAAIARRSPSAIIGEIARVAMNHSGEYHFGVVQVERTIVRRMSANRLYNFGVDDDESYIIRGGMVVHNCRGRWLSMPSAVLPPGVNPQFAEWLEKELKK